MSIVTHDSLGSFIYNHYREALDVIHTNSAELAEIQACLQIADGDFEVYLNEERAYLHSLTCELPEDTLHFDYVEHWMTSQRRGTFSHCITVSGLILPSNRGEWEAARSAANMIANTPGLSNIYNRIIQANRLVLSALTKHSNTDQRVALYENQLNLHLRWEMTSDKYKDVKKKVVEWEYRRALDELERLIVQRLFELTKMNLSGTGQFFNHTQTRSLTFAPFPGYKMRTQIAKGLQKRSEAIHKALGWYNAEASRLTLPHPKLGWKQIVDYTFLAEFDLLCHSRTNIHSALWAQPGHREATIKYLEVMRTCEEIQRLNVEYLHLRMHIHDEEALYLRTIDPVKDAQPALATELTKQWTLRCMVNLIHRGCLNCTEALSGYTGTHGVGVAVQGCHNESEHLVDEILSREMENVGIMDEEEVSRQTEGITDFITHIPD
jgi:hypothetical protein